MRDEEQDRDDGVPDDEEFDQFADLTNKLLKVPKKELDEQRENDAQNQTHGTT